MAKKSTKVLEPEVLPPVTYDEKGQPAISMDAFESRRSQALIDSVREGRYTFYAPTHLILADFIHIVAYLLHRLYPREAVPPTVESTADNPGVNYAGADLQQQVASLQTQLDALQAKIAVLEDNREKHQKYLELVARRLSTLAKSG